MANIKYSDKTPDIVRGLAMAGHTPFSIARHLGIATRTLSEWRKAHPELDAALESGLKHAIAEVTNALHRSATGYSYTKRTTKEVLDRDGEIRKLHEECVIDVAPNPLSIIFYLTNRDKFRWSRDPKNTEDENDETKIVFVD